MESTISEPPEGGGKHEHIEKGPRVLALWSLGVQGFRVLWVVGLFVEGLKLTVRCIGLCFEPGRAGKIP